MNLPMSGWLAQMLATDAPALPTAGAMQTGLHLGWAVVLAGLGVAAVGRWWPGTPPGARRLWGVALVLAIGAWLPGPYSPVHWLGLAFQMPSVLTVVLSASLLWDRLASGRAAAAPTVDVATERGTLALVVIGVLAGWALLLDTFALLPVQLYAWGFSPAAVGLVLLLVLLPWVALGSAAGARRCDPWLVPIALLVFGIWRLPTGNAWDAVLDPWLWLVLQGYLVRAAWRVCFRGLPLNA
jgi:hypothetical protein